MPSFTVKDGTEIYYKDWGNKSGQVVVFSHGWPLSSDNWDSQMFFLGNLGYRCIAHDRRGHGRSSQPWDGNDMDTYADDLAQLLDHLDVKDITLVGHSAGGGEITRYCGRHGLSRVSKAVLIAAVTPLCVKTDFNPNGIPMEYYDGFRGALVSDRANLLWAVPSTQFYGFNREGVTVNEGLVRSWWRQGMMAGFKNIYDCIKAFSETDMREDLKKMDIPVLILHGDDDQVVPFETTGKVAATLLPKPTLKVYPGGSHGIPNTEADKVNQDLLEFLKA